MPNWAKVVVALVATQAVFVAIWWFGLRAPTAANTGRPGVVQVIDEAELDVFAPPLRYTTVEGTERALADLRDTPVVVHFWGTWCPPCVDELPHLLDWDGGDGAALVAIAVDDDSESLRSFFGGVIPEQVVLAKDRSAPFDVERLPVTFLVSSEGRVIREWTGARDWDERDIADFMREP